MGIKPHGLKPMAVIFQYNLRIFVGLGNTENNHEVVEYE
jgi:hypothetical protein